MNNLSIKTIWKETVERPAPSAGDLFTYLAWRGDIPFSAVPPGSIDLLIFATLVYVDFGGIVPEDVGHAIPLREAVERLYAGGDLAAKVRVERDRALLLATAETERFGTIGMCYYQNTFVPEEETQFAAMTFVLPDGGAYLTFRGTDYSIAGWKEDFNMAFQESVPAQRLSEAYVARYAAEMQGAFHLCGHSKGGNLAIYAAAKSPEAIQSRILSVYNFDGPGFTEGMLEDAGYLRIVSKIHTYVPQSSVVGMLLTRKEPYTVVKCKRIGLLQHDPYAWTVLGREFVLLEERTAESRFIDRTVATWLANMTKEERNAFVDALFAIVTGEDNSMVQDLLEPQRLKSSVALLREDEARRRTIKSEIQKLMEAAKKVGLE